MKLVMDWTDENGEQNDEVCQITLVGSSMSEIINVNHDDHGWDGMRAVISAMKSVAQACNWEILTIGREGV